MISMLLGLLELPLVEGKFFTLQNVTISAAALTRAGGNACKETSALELILQGLVQLLAGSPVLLLCNHVPALLLTRFLFLGSLALCLFAQVHSVLLEVPLLERIAINLHNGVLQQGLRAHQLIAGGVVNDVENTHFLGAILRAPSVIAVIKAQSPVFHVASAATHRAHALVAQLG